MRLKGRRSRQWGGEIVEFAILLPFILLLFFGVVEMAVGFFDQAILTNASRAAAREAIRAAPTDGDFDNWNRSADAEQAANAASQRMFSWSGPETLGFAMTENGFCIDRTGQPARPRIRVTLTYPYRFWVLPSFMDGLADLTLTAETSMCRLPPQE
jgi:Flp pilus assembly protein TadG